MSKQALEGALEQAEDDLVPIREQVVHAGRAGARLAPDLLDAHTEDPSPRKTHERSVEERISTCATVLSQHHPAILGQGATSSLSWNIIPTQVTMTDIVITGASRGIGRALALALHEKPSWRLVLVARDAQRLNALAGELRERGHDAIVVAGDLSSIAEARDLGERLAGIVGERTTLVHNAGIWPTRRVVGVDGLEQAFVVNHLGPTALQRSLLSRGLLSRLLVVGAGASALGKFDAKRTPTGEDFSRLRTYCTTKLCFAITAREVARVHSELDVAVVHPGIVRTDLGASPGLLGKLLSLVKRRWESPEICAERLARMFERERWSPRGDARWFWEGEERAWFPAAEDPRTREAVRDVVSRFLDDAGENTVDRRAAEPAKQS